MVSVNHTQVFTKTDKALKHTQPHACMYTYTHTLLLSLSLSHTHTQTHSHSLSHSHSLPQPLSLSHTHTHTDTHMHGSSVLCVSDEGEQAWLRSMSRCHRSSSVIDCFRSAWPLPPQVSAMLAQGQPVSCDPCG